MTDTHGVLIGLSGGVDSAVAAALLIEQGHHVVGATLELRPGSVPAQGSSGGLEDAIDRAKSVADTLGIPHHVIDARHIFEEQVVRYFVEEYSAGRTPNPCIKCNARVRFGLLLEFAHRMGLTRIATGHYARLVGETLSLARGVDTAKDQSYVLAEVAPDLLRQVIFPLGEMTKPDVVSLAAHRGLVRYASVESQEICFIPDNDHRRFLRERLGDRPGPVVNRKGELLGRHRGTYNFTIGQRKGTGIAAGEPRYVVELAAERRMVVVGNAEETTVGAVTIGHIVHHRAAVGSTTVQLRSTGGALPARVTDSSTIVLDEAPAKGIAPGQTAVLYEGDAVVLAGTILSTQARAAPLPNPAQKGDE